MRKIKAVEIVQDLGIYPRCAVNKSHVQTLVYVLEAGGELPPLVICATTRKLVDGFHRLNAHLQRFGDECEVEVIEKEYASAKEIWLDAIRYNAKHGMPLTVSDREQCVLKCRRLGVDGEQLSLALGVRQSAIAALTTVQMKPAELRPSAKKPFVQNKYTATLPSVPGERCPDCGARLLQGAECVACQLKDKQQLAIAKTAERDVEGCRKMQREAVGLDDEASDQLPDGWEDRLAELRQVKQHGNELGFHVDWLLTFIEKWDGEDGAETLNALLEKLSARFGYELAEAAA